jgi:hypothetical protein
MEFFEQFKNAIEISGFFLSFPYIILQYIGFFALGCVFE